MNNYAAEDFEGANTPVLPPSLRLNGEHSGVYVHTLLAGEPLVLDVINNFRGDCALNATIAFDHAALSLSGLEAGCGFKRTPSGSLAPSGGITGRSMFTQDEDGNYTPRHE